MRKTIAFLAAASVVLVTAPTAQAEQVTGTNAVVITEDVTAVHDECVISDFSVTPTADFYDWDATVDVIAPDGSIHDADYLAKSLGDTTGATQLCDYEGYSDPKGKYQVLVEFTVWDENYNGTVENLAASFTFADHASEPDPVVDDPDPEVDEPAPVGKTASVLTVKRSKVGDFKWRVRGHLTRGGKAWVGRRVFFQAKVDGVWRSLYSKVTNDRGIVRWTSRPERGAGKILLRLHANGNSTTKPANSETFRLPFRG